MELVAADRFRFLHMQVSHALRAGNHPADHRDSFGGMLAAQSELEQATLVSLDVRVSGV
jgi:PIN domain nuclease of toxin-antitoxin system